MSDRVDIVEIIPVKKGNPTIVTGFTGPGFIGNTALMYLVRQKGYKQKVQLKSQLIPPMILLIQGVPTHVFRIYANNDDSVLFVLSEALISPEHSWSIGLKLMNWLIEKGVKEIISIEGMPFGAYGDSRPIFGYSNPQRSLTSYGIQSTSEGGISGINAVMLEESLKNRISWVSLFVPTDQAQTIDYGGSAAIIEVLNKMFKLGVDPEVLKKSDEIRRQMMQRSRNTEQKGGFFDSLRRRRNNSGIASY